jgi:putative ABC transport system substrate-binding protein
MVIHKATQHTTTRLMIGLMMIGLLLTACGGTPPAKTYTIGVVNYVPALESVLAGFKAQMTAFGHMEGQHVTYLYHGILEPDPQVIAREVQRLRDQQVDLFLTLGTRPALVAKQTLEGTAIPVVFAPVIDPVGQGMVESITRPGGHMTGVQDGNTLPKGLEWLHKVPPHATKVYAIYYPQDIVAQASIKPLRAMAPSLGIELVLEAVPSPAAAMAVIDTLSHDAAIFVVPTPRLQPLSALIERAVKHGIAVGASNHGYLSSMQGGAVVTYAGSFPAMGQQAARLADQILKGAKPADLPVETAEYFLHVNIQTATAIGLEIPDAILRQTDAVMR